MALDNFGFSVHCEVENLRPKNFEPLFSELARGDNVRRDGLIDIFRHHHLTANIVSRAETSDFYGAVLKRKGYVPDGLYPEDLLKAIRNALPSDEEDPVDDVKSLPVRVRRLDIWKGGSPAARFRRWLSIGNSAKLNQRRQVAIDVIKEASEGLGLPHDDIWVPEANRASVLIAASRNKYQAAVVTYAAHLIKEMVYFPEDLWVGPTIYQEID